MLGRKADGRSTKGTIKPQHSCYQCQKSSAADDSRLFDSYSYEKAVPLNASCLATASPRNKTREHGLLGLYLGTGVRHKQRFA